MKATRFYTLLALLLMAGGVTMQAQEVKVEASETIELMSIMARTAGFQEYHMDMAGKYTEETEAWAHTWRVSISRLILLWKDEKWIKE